MDQPNSLDAQSPQTLIAYRGRGNPASVHASTAISNCFPGLEFDLRAAWKRILDGVELHEATGVVVAVTSGSAAFAAGVRAGQALATVDGVDILLPVNGPREGNPAVVELERVVREFSNSLACLATKAGQQVVCRFRRDNGQIVTVTLTVRQVFDGPGIAEDAAAPGVLTQGLCSPWQNDYRECGCYYWAASRPDYVNVQVAGAADTGHNWMHRNRTPATPRNYIPENPQNPPPELLDYEELFRAWETELRFVRRGQDSE